MSDIPIEILLAGSPEFDKIAKELQTKVTTIKKKPGYTAKYFGPEGLMENTAFDQAMAQTLSEWSAKEVDKAMGMPDLGTSFGTTATTGSVPKESLTLEALEKAWESVKHLAPKPQFSDFLGDFNIVENPYVPKGTAYMGMDFGVPGSDKSVVAIYNVGDGTVEQVFDKSSESANIAMSDKAKKGEQDMEPITIYRFGAVNDPCTDPKPMLGGKGANLAVMAGLGFPVPPGFTIPANVSINYLQSPGMKAKVMEAVQEQLVAGMQYLRDQFGFMPLVSVRSGARVSMPGMMDTILNVGIDDANLDQWKERIGERAALDSYRRFLQMYGATAMGIPMEQFEHQLADIRQSAKAETDADIPASHLERLIKRYKDVYAANHASVPDRASALVGAVSAVFESWMTPRAISYRKDNNIPDDWGTAVNIQAMVFGNADDKSCSGVAFTRDRDSGINTPMGDYLVNAQGEDVVAGIRPTDPLHKMQAWNPKVYQELNDLMIKLEQHFKFPQDIEFTVQFGKLWMLQTRDAKLASAAVFQVLHDMVQEGMLTKAEAMARVGPAQLLAMFKPVIDPKYKGKPLAQGFAAGGRVVTGVAMFSSSAAIAAKAKGQDVILVRKETDPDDYDGIMASVGVLTSTGGATSHAAVVARGKDKTCVVGCTSLMIQGIHASGEQFGNDYHFKQGSEISIDGDTGNVYLGVVPVIEPKVTEAVQLVASWFGEAGKAHRITGANLIELGKALVGFSGEVAYVDTCTLPDDTDYGLLGTFIVESGFKQVVLDLSEVDAHYTVTDKAFNKMFGFNPLNGQSNAKAGKLMAFPPEAAAKTIVKLPKGSTSGDALRKKGFRVVGAVNTVADLLDAGGAVTVDEETIKTVFGTVEAYNFVQDALKKSGKTPAQPVPEPCYWYEPLLRKGV